ncbi:Uncharacterised protein [Mycobacteroides abscessus subsp. abscessus]|nr:Uncharacterised protein [Mycobacteroides abscessus subsp. abscessus]
MRSLARVVVASIAATARMDSSPASCPSLSLSSFSSSTSTSTTATIRVARCPDSREPSATCTPRRFNRPVSGS